MIGKSSKKTHRFVAIAPVCCKLKNYMKCILKNIIKTIISIYNITY